jgi:CAAX prenyl protease-like protein
MMQSLRSAARPALARSAPFVVYLVFLAVESTLPPTIAARFDPHWLYLVQIAATAGVLARCWPVYGELREREWRMGWVIASVAVGLAVFAAWRVLDQPWATVGSARPLEPAIRLFPEHLVFASARLAGAVLLVPVMEELFWRSFLTRWLDRSDFLALAPRLISLRAVAGGAVLFGLEHSLLLAGIVAGLAFAELYRRCGNLWYVLLAHAVTNAMIELIPTQ